MAHGVCTHPDICSCTGACMLVCVTCQMIYIYMHISIYMYIYIYIYILIYSRMHISVHSVQNDMQLRV